MLMLITMVSRFIPLCWAGSFPSYRLLTKFTFFCSLDHHNQHHSHAKKATAEVAGSSKHFHALMRRVNDEMMVLGFLAFVVWSVNQGVILLNNKSVDLIPLINQ